MQAEKLGRRQGEVALFGLSFVIFVVQTALGWAVFTFAYPQFPAAVVLVD